MKKKLKIFLSVFVIILVAAGSYLLYTFKFKEYDVADEEVEQIVKDPYEIELPDGTKLTLDEDGGVADSGQVDEKTAGSVDGGNAPATDGSADSSEGAVRRKTNWLSLGNSLPAIQAPVRLETANRPEQQTD